MNARCNLIPYRFRWQIHSRHQRQGLETRQRFGGTVGVRRRQRAIMTRIHRLEHVQCLTPAAFPNHNAIGTHTKRIPHQVPYRVLPLAFHVRRTRLQRYHVRLLELEFRRILDRNDSLIFRNRRRQHIQ
ncbi:MAG: hypothetical protein BWY17_05340 [Deltaproteobacteria bacterium ADurb.Bin207]|nr:MAG: hypothetical protein BWY17_05340 [Deltaproteobacteria bacterium ADurb.Bin207]